MKQRTKEVIGIMAGLGGLLGAIVWLASNAKAAEQQQKATCRDGDIPMPPNGDCGYGYLPDPTHPNTCCSPISCPSTDALQYADGSCPPGYLTDDGNEGCCSPAE